MRLIAMLKELRAAQRLLRAGETAAAMDLIVRVHIARVEEALLYKYSEADIRLLTEAATTKHQEVAARSVFFPMSATGKVVKKWVWLWAERAASLRVQARADSDPLKKTFDPAVAQAKLLQAGFPPRLLEAK